MRKVLILSLIICIMVLVNIPLAFALRDINVSPTSWDYEGVNLGSSSDQTFTISNEGSGSFGNLLEVESLTLVGDDADEFSIDDDSPFNLNLGEFKNIVVTFTPSSVGSKSAILRIESDDPNESQVDVELSGTGVVPDIAIDPTEADFSYVDVGSTQDISFTVSNTGAGDLIISSADDVSLIGTNPGEFAFVSGKEAFNLSTGQEHNIVVQFAPTSEGLKEAELSIVSNDPDPAENPLLITMSGTGTKLGNPAIVQYEPEDQTFADFTNVDIHIFFSEPMNTDSVLDSVFLRRQDGVPEIAASLRDQLFWFGPEGVVMPNTLNISWEDDDATLVISSEAELSTYASPGTGNIFREGGTYILEIVEGQLTATDKSGNPLELSEGQTLYTFYTPDFGDASLNKELTLLDATLLAQHVLNISDIFDDFAGFGLSQDLAIYILNVNRDSRFPIGGSEDLTLLDATFIAQKVLNIIDEFPVEQSEGAPTLKPLSPTEISTRAVSLNYNQSGISIDLDNATDIHCAEVRLTYDSNALAISKVTKTDFTSESILEHYKSSGELRLALINPHPLYDNGSLVDIQFNPAQGSHEVNLDSVKLTKVELNVGNIGARLEKLPNKTTLLQNYPNPFNPETWIPYKLNQTADVDIYIYNMNGQLVRMIRLGKQNPGNYVTKDKAVHWDGKNNNGERVASGIYFYQLNAGERSFAKKMVILK